MEHFNVAADDTTAPVIDADFAFGDTFTTSPITLSGTATDNVGVDQVRVAIRDRNAGLWLQDDMTTFGPFRRFDATLSNPGAPATDRSFDVPLPDGNYALSARAPTWQTTKNPSHHEDTSTSDRDKASAGSVLGQPDVQSLCGSPRI